MAIKTILLRRPATSTTLVTTLTETPSYGEPIYAQAQTKMGTPTTGPSYTYVGKTLVVGDRATAARNLPRFDAVPAARSRLEVFHEVITDATTGRSEDTLTDIDGHVLEDLGGKVKSITGANGTDIIDATTKAADMYKIIHYGDTTPPASAILWVKTDGVAQIRDSGGTWHKIFAIWG